MNISKIITVFLLLCVIAIFAINPNSEKKYYSTSVTMDNNLFVPDIQYFKDGDTLLPDYAIIDTLVVVDAINLNKKMQLIEQGIIDATDGDIAFIFYKYCKVIPNSLYNIQFQKIKALYPKWSDLKVDSAIIED